MFPQSDFCTYQCHIKLSHYCDTDELLLIYLGHVLYSYRCCSLKLKSWGCHEVSENQACLIAMEYWLTVGLEDEMAYWGGGLYGTRTGAFYVL